MAEVFNAAGLGAIQKGVSYQLGIAEYIARFISENILPDYKPEELVGPVIIGCAVLTALILFFSLSIGTENPAAGGFGPEAVPEKKDE